MALILIGTGVSFDLTLAGLEALKSCDEAYIETYTNPVDEAKIRALERACGKKITLLPRERLESPFLADRARTANVCILASGDPLTATTHVTLVMEARQKGVAVDVIHNSSIYSAAPARAGLQIYRFGRTASLVNPRPNYKPSSSLDVIRENLARNAHSLVLLDTEPRPMEAKAALEMLAEFDNAVVLSRVGLPDEKITYGKISDLAKQAGKLGTPPFTVIVPAKLHPVEEEFLEMLK
ncbi:MAG: diphthine synthase [Candidatus ainarchaeum sp.]|nr:diphthine synthase [Candidatus ainarchaeum sp.]